MTPLKALLPALLLPLLAMTGTYASAEEAQSSAALAARSAGAKLALKVPLAPIEAVPGSWVTVKVTVRNPARTAVRRVALRVGAPQGVTLSAAKVKVGNLGPRARRTANVRVRLDTVAAAKISVRATSRTTVSRPKTFSLAAPPTSPPPPGVETAWRGNFTGATDEGVGFTLSADGTTITSWTAPRVYGYCTDLGSGFAWYPDTDIASMPVDAAGNFVGSSSYVDSGGFSHTVQLSGTISGKTVVQGSLAHTATWVNEGSTSSCSISDAQQTWTAVQG